MAKKKIEPIDSEIEIDLEGDEIDGLEELGLDEPLIEDDEDALLDDDDEDDDESMGATIVRKPGDDDDDEYDEDDTKNTNETLFRHNLPEDKPYGALKGGTKPSYRQYFNKTLKRHHNNGTANSDFHSQNEGNASKNNKKKSSKPKQKHFPRKIKQIKRKTTVKKYKLGSYGKKISILIKNNKTIKKIQNAQRELKNVPIHDVKNELIRNNLLKLGSTAPSNLLRKMYEDANMAGKVVNVGGDTFIHNFMKDGDKKNY